MTIGHGGGPVISNSFLRGQCFQLRWIQTKTSPIVKI